LRVREQVAHLRTTSPGMALSDAMAHRRAIEKLAPPSILVDDAHRVIHLSESVGRFLQPSGGALTGDVVDLVRPELRFELRSALHRIFEQQSASLSLPIPVRFNGRPRRVLIQVKTTKADEVGEARNAVVIFIEGEEMEEGLAKSDDHA